MQPTVQKANEMEVLPPPSDAYIAAAEAKSLEFMNPKRWKAMEVMAQTFIQAGALPSTIKNAGQLIMVFQAGYERGMQPLESIDSFYFVNGKLTMYGDMAIAQVLKAGHSIKWGTCDATTATVTITRGDTKEAQTATFTMAQAQTRKLAYDSSGKVKDVWHKFPENMLRFKAFSLVAKFHVPDALRGTAIKEDIEGGEAEVVAQAPAGVTPVASTTTDKQAAARPTLADALKPAPQKPAPEAELAPQKEAPGSEQ